MKPIIIIPEFTLPGSRATAYQRILDQIEEDERKRSFSYRIQISIRKVMKFFGVNLNV